MPKIALIHDHLVQDGGAEQVLKVLKEMFPEAPIFTIVADKTKTNGYFANKEIKTSFLQSFPWGVKKYQWYLPFMPAAIESHDLRGYDLVISSASSFAKGVITHPGTTHICYCHTPTRYLWHDTQNYLDELKVIAPIKKFLPLTLRQLRTWDRLAVNRVDYFIANSQTVAGRIKKYYQRNSQVIYPPVDMAQFAISDRPKKYFLAGGRLVPYKRFDLAVLAFSRLGIPLKIFGLGPELRRLKSLAKPNVEFLGKVNDEAKGELYANCLAYLNPQEEDFGITAIEAMASGRPVIAYNRGGATETIEPGLSGEFFDEQIWEDLADMVIRFQPEKYDPLAIRRHAERFSTERFKKQMGELISAVTDKEFKTHDL
ncbi:MAG: glycosyltransferase [Patescibacteria group bacterium]|jgi:glycosyltransferase involved in cell wall biosynthesis